LFWQVSTGQGKRVAGSLASKSADQRQRLHDSKTAANFFHTSFTVDFLDPLPALQARNFFLADRRFLGICRKSLSPVLAS
jgi:hypothetical protein